MKNKKYVATFESNNNNNSMSIKSISFIDLNAEESRDNIHTCDGVEDFLNALYDTGVNSRVYFHDLKIAGNFMINWLIDSDRYKEGVDPEGKLRKRDDLLPYRYTYVVSTSGEWYSITIKGKKNIISLYDSSKLLPFTIDDIKTNFRTIADDPILILYEALNEMFSRGYNKMTIGACCMAEYKQWCEFDKQEWEMYFPDLTKVDCPVDGYKDADDYIRKAYHGGWCYLKPNKQNKLIKNGVTADVNGLYSYVMHSDSGNVFPIGKPRWFKGELPEFLDDTFANGRRKYYYFVRISTRFYIKRKMLPTVQIKGSPYYHSREWLENSDYKGNKFVIDMDNHMVPVKPTMVLTMTDFKLLQEHYKLEELEILDGCYFMATDGLFDRYINKFAVLKSRATNPVDRTIAKLMLNNLSGKFAASPVNEYKMFSKSEDGIYAKDTIEEKKRVGYIPIGAAITSYGRAFTITAAQNNFDSFIYSDTDSIHCNCSAEDLKEVPMHMKKLGYWKYETTWDQAIFVRQKTCIEHIIEENLNPVEKPYFKITCAGMGVDSKDTICARLEENDIKITDFKPGLKISNNVKAVSMNGGVTFENHEFVIR